MRGGRFARKGLFIAFLALASGCAGTLYHDRLGRNDPGYYSGMIGIGAPRGPFLERPGRGADAEARPAEPGMPQDMAAINLFASAISLAANPDYYKKSTIGGRCVMDAPVDSNLDIPCLNVIVVLTDSQGREVGRAPTTNGTFTFPVEKGKEHFLAILSDRYRMDTERLGPVAMGDDVLIRLSPRKP